MPGKGKEKTPDPEPYSETQDAALPAAPEPASSRRRWWSPRPSGVEGIPFPAWEYWPFKYDTDHLAAADTPLAASSSPPTSSAKARKGGHRRIVSAPVRAAPPISSPPPPRVVAQGDTLTALPQIASSIKRRSHHRRWHSLPFRTRQPPSPPSVAPPVQQPREMPYIPPEWPVVNPRLMASYYPGQEGTLTTSSNRRSAEGVVVGVPRRRRSVDYGPIMALDDIPISLHALTSSESASSIAAREASVEGSRSRRAAEPPASRPSPFADRVSVSAQGSPAARPRRARVAEAGSLMPEQTVREPVPRTSYEARRATPNRGRAAAQESASPAEILDPADQYRLIIPSSLYASARRDGALATLTEEPEADSWDDRAPLSHDLRDSPAASSTCANPSSLSPPARDEQFANPSEMPVPEPSTGAATQGEESLHNLPSPASGRTYASSPTLGEAGLIGGLGLSNMPARGSSTRAARVSEYPPYNVPSSVPSQPRSIPRRNREDEPRARLGRNVAGPVRRSGYSSSTSPPFEPRSTLTNQQNEVATTYAMSQPWPTVQEVGATPVSPLMSPWSHDDPEYCTADLKTACVRCNALAGSRI